jgi:hypothetical protein
VATLKCGTCGAEQDASERFCTVCQAYLWWDRTEEATVDSFGGTTHLDVLRPDGQVGDAAAAPAVSETPLEPPPPPPQEQQQQAAAFAAGPGATTPGPPEAAERAPAPDTGEQPTPTTPSDRFAAVPEVVLETNQVTIGAHGSGTLVLEVTNPSSIVDGYDIAIPGAPPWLVADAEDTHLMPGESRKIAVKLSVRSDEIVLAQRIGVRVEVASQADQARRAEAVVDVVVPPSGPLMSLSIRPAILRLQDVAAGRFVLVLDNRSSNHPQTFQLSASDPEGVVRFGFDRRRVTVRPGGVDESIVEFSAPLPEPGLEVTRQLTITAAHPDGEVTVPLLVIQRRQQAPVDEPIRVRLSPAHITSVNGSDVDFEVQVDNRGGHSPKTVVLTARDAENRLTFAFAPRQLTIASGTTARANARVRAAPPPAGTTEMLPFTVVASNGQMDTEAQGQLEATATPDPISTAALQVSSPHVRLPGGVNRTAFDVVVDNREGHEALHVWLTGTSEDGEAVVRFDPSEVFIAARSTARARVVVTAPRPRAGESITRNLELRASDGRRAVSASTKVTQTAHDLRPVLSRVLVIFGAGFVVIGSLLLWVGTERVLPSPGLFQQELNRQSILEVDWTRLVEGTARAVVLVLAAMMALGTTSRTGGLTRKSAALIVLLTAGLLIATLVLPGSAFRPPEYGLFVVWFGAVLGYIGGVLAQQRQDR